MNLYESVKNKLTESNSRDKEYYPSQVSTILDDLLILAREAHVDNHLKLYYDLLRAVDILEDIPKDCYINNSNNTQDSKEVKDSENLSEGSVKDIINEHIRKAKENGVIYAPLYVTDDYALCYYKGKYGSRLQVEVSEDVHNSNITVYIDDNADSNKGEATKVVSAKVNWPSIGATSSEEAVDFANQLKTAADFANAINGKDFSDELRKQGYID